jgi:hypothetical protein
LFEAGRRRNPAIGVELNPAAAYIARVYKLINCCPEERSELIATTKRYLQDVLSDSGPLFSHGRKEELRTDLRRLLAQSVSEYQRILVTALLVTLPDEPLLAVREAPRRWEQLCQTVEHLPYSASPINVEIADARKLPICAESIDFVLTSPPYINVFNYHQNQRGAAESLGWPTLRIARSEIGSNRKHRQNRFLTVTQYCLDIGRVLLELKRVCRRNAELIFVVGRESNVRKTPFFNGEIFIELATRCSGFSLALAQQRVFTNRFGRQIYEDVLHFEYGSCSSLALKQPKQVATEVLLEARGRAPKESLADLQLALAHIDSVAESPLFDLAGLGTVESQ